MYTYKVYIQIDSDRYVIAINSSAFLTDTTDWIQIDEGNNPPDKYHHAMGNYFDKPLFDENRCHNYIYQNLSVRETTVEEKSTELAGFPALQPTLEEKMRADIEYLSAMTGVTL